MRAAKEARVRMDRLRQSWFGLGESMFFILS
jgi:hypothetical protein